MRDVSFTFGADVHTPNSTPLLILALMTAAGAAAYYLSLGLVPKADIVYVHYLSFRWFEPEQAVATLQRFAAAMPEEAYDFERRELAAFNYPVLAITGRIGDALFGASLVSAMATAQIAAACLGFAIAFFGFACARRFAGAVALTIAFFALTAFLPGPQPTDHLLYYGPVENLINLVVLMLSPGEAFSLLSFWPKSSLALILLAALVLRWSGRMTLAYLLLASGMLFHITLGGLVLFAVAIMDVTLRPTAVAWRYAAPVLIVAAGAMWAGQWEIFSQTGHLPLLIGGGVVAVLVGVAANRWLAEYSAHFDLMVCDALVFVFAAVVVTPLSMGLYMATHTEGLWGPEASYIQVAARLLVLAFAVSVLALCVLAQRWFEQRQSDAAMVVIAAIVALVTLYGAAGSWWWELRDLSTEMSALDTEARAEPTTQIYWRTINELASSP